MRRRAGAAATLLLLGSVSACSGPDEATATALTTQFYAAVGAGNGAAACDLLAPRTKSDLEQSAKTSCDKAILDEDIPAVGRPIGTEQFGTTAQVDFGNEKTFLARFQGGWKVMAAGCKPQKPDQPYDCQVSGG